MSGGMFLLRGEDNLVELSQQPYDSEALLQELLARFPALLAGDQVDPTDPRRWLFIAREAGVPDGDQGGDRWYVDHLFLDQDGIPTLVEVKRSSDSRIRREVVGQMLDYAAHAIAHWSVERIQAALHVTLQGNMDGVLGSFLEGVDPAAYWQRVQTNLLAGRIRMLFVADEIPPELRRVVAFLNRQMNPAEVLAIEIRQFVGSDVRSLVPRVYGHPEDADRKSARSSPGRQWDEASFLEELGRRQPMVCVEFTRRVIGWARDRGARFWFGRGRIEGSLFPCFDRNGQSYYAAGLRTTGAVEMQFQNLRLRPPFDRPEVLEELRQRFNLIPGVNIAADALMGRPSFAMTLIASDSGGERFFEALDWFLQQLPADRATVATSLAPR